MANLRDGDDPPKRQPKLAKPTRYDVGYGKPPIGTRFKPGQSGNPNGRPKGSKNKLPALNEERLKSIILQEAYRTIKVRDGDKNVSVPMATAVVRSVALNAAKGNNRAAALFTQMVKVVEDENKALHDEWQNTAINYKVEWEKELARREKSGIEAEDPIPHPDDLVINMQTGTVRILGPMTRDEKQLWDEARKVKLDLSESIKVAERSLERERDPDKRQQLIESINENRSLLERIAALPPNRKALD